MPRKKHAKRKPSRLGHVPVQIQRLDETGAGVGVIAEPPSSQAPEASHAILHVVDDDEAAKINGARSGALADIRSVRVPGTLPQELVEAELVHVQRDGLAHGVLSKVVRPSLDRVPPECPHFLTCGGCDLLHVQDAAQRRFKRQWVAEALGLSGEAVDEVLYASTGERNFGYRTLAKLVVGPERVLGSYRPRTHDVVDMTGCLVHAPLVERVVQRIRSWVVDYPGMLDLRYVLVRASQAEQRVVVTLVSRTQDAPGGRLLAEALKDHDDVAKVALHVNDAPGDGLIAEGGFEILWTRGPVLEQIDEAVQQVEPGAFLQVNPQAAAQLYQFVADALEPSGRHLLDLYAGSGAFSAVLLARMAASVLAVDTTLAAGDAARAALSPWGSRFEMRVDTVARVLETLEPGRFSLAVLNPPRKGAGPEVMHLLAGLELQRIVYVSCNPSSLADDLAVLTKDDGYRLSSATPLDMFPQTRHVETIVVLERLRAA